MRCKESDNGVVPLRLGNARRGKVIAMISLTIIIIISF